MTTESLEVETESPFQRQFRLNDEFYSGKQIRDAILSSFKEHDGRLSILGGLWSISTPEDKTSFIKKSDLERLIPDNPEDAFKFDGKETQSDHYYYISESTALKIYPDSDERFGVYPLTTFFPTDLGYICIKKELRD